MRNPEIGASAVGFVVGFCCSAVLSYATSRDWIPPQTVGDILGGAAIVAPVTGITAALTSLALGYVYRRSSGAHDGRGAYLFLGAVAGMLIGGALTFAVAFTYFRITSTLDEGMTAGMTGGLSVGLLSAVSGCVIGGLMLFRRRRG